MIYIGASVMRLDKDGYPNLDSEQSILLIADREQ